MEASYYQPHQALFDKVNQMLESYRQHFEQFNVRQLRRLNPSHFLNDQNYYDCEECIENNWMKTHTFIESDKREQLIVNLHKPSVKRANDNIILIESTKDLKPTLSSCKISE